LEIGYQFVVAQCLRVTTPTRNASGLNQTSTTTF